MNQNGKGDASRPIFVDRKTYEDNWNRIFSENKNADELLESKLYDEYMDLLKSGMFFEMFPALTGEWDKDKIRFKSLRQEG